MKKFLLAAAFLVAFVGSAQAYTAYIKPSEFYPNDARVDIEGTFATNFFTPGIALAGEFDILEPSGSEGIFSRIEITGDTAELGASLTTAGTYRVNSGEIYGQVATLVAIDGNWRPLAAGETPPVGAETTTLQTVTVSDVYITRGSPSRENVDRTIGRLALRPVTHPNEVLVNQGFQVQALFDGQPFANAALVLYREGDPETDLDTYFATDANGNATVTISEPGAYVLAARHRAESPAGSEAAVHSYTTTLTFEALSQLYPVTEVTTAAAEEPEEPRRRNRREYGMRGLRN